MSKTITLLTEEDNIESINGHVGLLFECAPDASVRQRFSNAIVLSDLIGGFDAIKTKAAVLARKMLEEEPTLRGIRQLEVFEEKVILELQFIFHANNLYSTLENLGYSECLITGQSRIEQYLDQIALQTGLALKIVRKKSIGAASGRTSSILRSWGRLRSSGFARVAIANEWRQVMERIDPYHLLRHLGGTGPVEKGLIWFYSTANTFTRIGMLYEPWFPQRFNYLVENPLTGGAPLRDAKRSFKSLYGYVKRSMVPRKEELEEARCAIHEHLKSVKLDAEEDLVRNLYIDSQELEYFITRLLPRGLFTSTLLARFIESTSPSAVVVGNPDGYIFHAASEAGVPTFLLQHGILGDFCQFTDPPVDHYIVRGRFWKEFLSPKAAKRAKIINPPRQEIAVKYLKRIQRKKVVFLTIPYSIQRFLDDSDLDDTLVALLTVCSHAKSELVIRVHPLEQIGTYRRIVKRLLVQLDRQVDVTYSQGEGLDELLEQSAVAVTYCSTVFLDCLRHNVPIVSFGWHDFSYKQQISNYGVFHFCSSLQQLGTMVERAIQGQLPSYAESIEPFLARTSPDETRSRLCELLNKSELQ